MKKIHNKLIRDKITDMLNEQGIQSQVKQLNKEEYQLALTKKLHEETLEFQTAEDLPNKLEELADVLEVIHAILKSNDLTFEELEAVRHEKFAQRGGFSEALFLEHTCDCPFCCPHCDVKGWAFEFMLQEYTYFTVVCDSHPLCEGHLLIIPKRHAVCMGDYTLEELAEFKRIYHQTGQWILKEYGSLATFEHGKIGQSVFHSHVHLMPFVGTPEQIIPEGADKLQPLESLDDLKEIFLSQGQYLFLTIGQEMWLVDTSLGMPRFFRDRFAHILNCPERANWKDLRQNPAQLALTHSQNQACQNKYKICLKPEGRIFV